MSTTRWISAGIGLFIVLILLFALAPGMFESAAGLNETDAPAWFADNMGTFVAIVLLLMVLGAGGLYAYGRR
jgi:hypothetical protein